MNEAPHNTVALLIAKITEVIANLPRATMAKACKCFQPRIVAVVEAGDGFFKESHSTWTSEM